MDRFHFEGAMSNLIQTATPAATNVQPSKASAKSINESQELSDDQTGFSSALASAESETESTENNLIESSSVAGNDQLAEQDIASGNALPAEEQAAIWQALMLLQPDSAADEQAILLQAAVITPGTDKAASNLLAPELQNINLLEGKNKSVLNPNMLKQDYFNFLSSLNKDATSTPSSGFAANNIALQLAGAQFSKDSNETLMANMPEQFQPIQGINTTLSNSLSAVGLGTATQAAATQTQMAPLNLGQNAWETNLSSRLQMMVGQNVQSAEIRLDPPELGSLDIKIKINNDVAAVHITSANSHVRDALETAIPKLREMFAESGVALGDVNVRQESFSQQQNNDDGKVNFSHGVAESEAEEETMIVSRTIPNDSLLDIYA